MSYLTGLNGNSRLIPVFFDDIGLVDVALLDIGEFLQTDTALVTLSDLLLVVFKALQGDHLIVADDDAVSSSARR